MAETLTYLIWHERWQVAKIGICGVGTNRIERHGAHGFKTVATIRFRTRSQAVGLEAAVKAAWRRRGWAAVDDGPDDYQAWVSQAGGVTETVSLAQCGSVADLWKMVEDTAEQLGGWVGMDRLNVGLATAPATCCPDPSGVHRDLDRQELTFERRIVWLEAPEDHEYVRQKLMTTFHRTGRDDLLPRSTQYSRCIGYAELERGAPYHTGSMFMRRLFHVTRWDRCWDPNGAYRTRCPIEAVDPLTVEAGVSGRLTERAWGGLIPPPVRGQMPCPYRHQFTDDPLDRPYRGDGDLEWVRRWQGTWKPGGNRSIESRL